MATTIRVRKNGPYLVEGDDVKVVEPIALCRCGGSTNKPFCDGTHSKVGFQAAEAAIGPDAADKPAG